MSKFDPSRFAAALSGSTLPLVGGAGVLAGLVYGANNFLYNVDAGHRAIKFHRLSGIGKEVEGGWSRKRKFNL